MVPALEIGDVLDERYRIDAVLGRGGTGVVYEATDLGSERRVAIKVLNEESEDSARGRARFERELQSIAQLRGPHTVKLFGHGDVGGRPYLVFELLGGRDLDAVLAEFGRLQPDVVEHILRQALASLREAHLAGLLHRDVKPANMRIFPYGDDPWTLKLLDFGIARRMDADAPSLTATGELVGTPRYMSPEQLLSEELTAASDIYSLGLATFEMLVGRDALQGNAWGDQLDRLQTGHLLALPDGSAGRLAQIVQKMTSRNPRERFQSAEAVLNALDDPAWVLAVPVTAPPPRSPTASEQHPVPAERSGVRPPHVVAGLGLVAVVIAVLVWVNQSPPPPQAAVGIRAPNSLVATDSVEPEPIRDLGHVQDVRDEPDLDPMRASGCGFAPPMVGGGDLEGIQDLTRDRWFVHVPTRYDSSRKYPVVVLLHQALETLDQLVIASKFDEVAEENEFILVGPRDDAPLPWRDPGSGRRVANIVGQTKRDFCVDDERVFVVGHTQGGVLADALTCEPWVKGVATHSHRRGSLRGGCTASLPYMFMSPLRSQNPPFDGESRPMCMWKYSRPSVPEVEKYWRARNGCSGDKRRAFAYKGSECWRWGCGDSKFESCHLDGGHGWAGSVAHDGGISAIMQCDSPPADFPTASRIWAFFSNINAPADGGLREAQ